MILYTSFLYTLMQYNTLFSTFSFFTFEYLWDSIHLLRSQINYNTSGERYGIT